MKYQLFLDLVRDNFATLKKHGGFKEKTLNDYLNNKVKAKPVSIIAIAEILRKTGEYIHK